MMTSDSPDPCKNAHPLHAGHGSLSLDFICPRDFALILMRTNAGFSMEKRVEGKQKNPGKEGKSLDQSGL